MDYTKLSYSELITESDTDATRLREEGFPAPYFDLAFDYWRANATPSELPHVRTIDPVLLPTKCLPWVDLVEVEPNPRRFKIRLWGTRIVQVVGTDLTGTYFDEAGMAGASRRLEQVVERRVPYFATIPLDWHADYDRHDLYYCSLGLPFKDDAGAVSRVLCLLYFHPRAFDVMVEKSMRSD